MAIRSGLTTVIWAAISRTAAAVSASIEKPNAAAKRTARSIRSLSSPNRNRGGPIARIRRFCKSSCPPTKSITLPVDGVEEHAVDGEIAAGGVFAGGTEGDVIGMAAVAIFRVLAEGGHFDHARRPRPQHGDHAEGGAQRQGSLVAEQARISGGVALVATS